MSQEPGGLDPESPYPTVEESAAPTPVDPQHQAPLAPPHDPYGSAEAPAGRPVPDGYWPLAGYPAASYYGWAPSTQPRNGLGTAALVCGVLSLLGCLPVGPLAVIFGINGQMRARRGGATNGSSAVAGIVTGAIGTALALAAVAKLLSMAGCLDSGSCV